MHRFGDSVTFWNPGPGWICFDNCFETGGPTPNIFPETDPVGSPLAWTYVFKDMWRVQNTD